MRIFNAERVPKPRLNHELPHVSGPLDLEIGAGQGLHAVQYAANHPERVLLAVERTHTRFALLERRAQNHTHLKNLVPIHADAIGFTTHHLAENSLERIFLLYPNPYPKAKQANLRWHNSPFMRLLVSKLKCDGTLTLATNLEWYAREAQATMVDTWHMELTSCEKVSSQSAPRTHFEKKYIARGETCWNLQFRKVQ